MLEIIFSDYEAFMAGHDDVLIEDKPIPLTGPKTVKTIRPADFEREQSQSGLSQTEGIGRHTKPTIEGTGPHTSSATS